MDDGSTDKTLEVINSLKSDKIRIISNDNNRGKGYSIREGVKIAKGEIILVTDADLSTPIQEFEKLLIKHKQGYPFVIGSRSKKDSNILIKQNILRIFLGKMFNFLIRLILGLKYKDTQCGFKLYDKSKLNSIISYCKVDRFCSDVEIIYLAKLNNIQIYEQGITWIDEKKSSVKLISDPINMFKDLIKIKFSKY